MRMPPHLSIGEINVICTDLERSLRFYRDVLGFEPVEREGVAYHLRCGTTRFLLLPVAANAREPVPYCSVPEISFDVMTDDIAATVEHFKAHGVEFIKEFEPGASSVFVRDPDGLVVEVIGRAEGGGRREEGKDEV